MINLDYFIKWQELDVEVQKSSKQENITKYLPIASNNNVFISNNIRMNRSFSVEFNPETMTNYSAKKVNGIEIKVQRNNQINKEKKYLVMCNIDSKNDDAFMGFSAHIFDSLVGSKSDAEALNYIEKALDDYHNFFSFKSELSKETEQGLIAELMFLNEMIGQNGENAVLNWFGSEGNKRDFIFDDYGVEIKSTRNQKQDIIHVSNENQLDRGNLEKLYVKLYIFDENDQGENISDYISLILTKIKSFELQKIFRAKVALIGIDPNVYVGKYKFVLEDIHTYLIDDSFPCITKKDIPECIFDVKYNLNLSSIPYIEKLR